MSSVSFIKIRFSSNDLIVTPVDEEPVEGVSEPLDIRLRIDLEETREVRLYAETNPGYLARDTIIRIIRHIEPGQEGLPDTTSKWALAPDNGGQPGAYANWEPSFTLGMSGMARPH